MSNEIIDVRATDAGEEGDSIAALVHRGLEQNPKTLPTLLLYDEAGLLAYDAITTEARDEYYLFSAEEEILKNHGDDIVSTMHWRNGGKITPGEVVIELGAGALRKTSHILLALARLVSTPEAAPPVTYYALDLEKRELARTLGDITSSDVGKLLEGKVATKGMWGTYDGGLKFVVEGGLRGRSFVQAQSSLHKPSRDSSPTSHSDSSASSGGNATYDTAPSTPDASQEEDLPLHLMFLGSSLGNFDRGEDVGFLRSLPLRAGSGDTILIGLDHDNDPTLIERAYNDSKGITRRFIMNGLVGAGKALGDESLFDPEKWEYVNRYNIKERCHEAYYKSKCPQSIRDSMSGKTFTFAADELINVEVSNKYSDSDAYRLFTNANLRPIQRWTDSASRYSLWLLERPPFNFPLPSVSTPFGVPEVSDWKVMWKAWDSIAQMISPELLHQKPIDLRHICLFYLGHIPTFLDIHLSRLLGEPHTEPENFQTIFERGIDPNVEDPTKCHPHSKVPTTDAEWPSLASIMDFKARVRTRLLALYGDIEAGRRLLDCKTARVLFMTYEHEALHAETLLYMLIQRAGSGTLPPQGFTAPPWESLSIGWSEPELKSPTTTLGPTTISLGHDDIEKDDHSVVFDPTHEFGWDNESPKREVKVDAFRISWRPITNGQFHEFYKSSSEVTLPASWIEAEDGGIAVRTLHGPVPLKIAYNWPVVTSGKDLSHYAQVQGGRLPTESELRLFYDLFEGGYEGGGNVGFRNWHPVPATTGGERSGGKGHNGGVWEWTSTVFDKTEGFVSSELYPGYSTDFFNGAHQVVLGGSCGTIPRIAGRRSFRNWYQTVYPFAWAGARVVWDA